MNQIILGNNIDVLPRLPKKSVNLIYIDPPFNTGKEQKHTNGTYQDSFINLEAFLMPRIESAVELLQKNGSLFVHLDAREVHYIKVALDKLLGRKNFQNEIVWAYDYGGRSKGKWPSKHDTILWYTLNPYDYTFNLKEIERIPYMAPGLVSLEKSKQGKIPTDVWWHTIVPTNGKEKTGYPTQKPLGILDRIIKAHSNEGDTVIDFFCGSGTTGEAAGNNGRNFILIDKNPEAIKIAKMRLDKFYPEYIEFKL